MADGPLVGWLQTLSVDSVWGLLQGLYVLGFLLYALFAVVVVSQIKQMVATLNGSMDAVIKTLGWVHLAVAIGALVLSIVVL